MPLAKITLLADQGVYGQLASRIASEQSRAALDQQDFEISHGRCAFRQTWQETGLNR